MEDFLTGKKHVHFIGIGGSGMYPLAQILHSKGFYLTGSDNNETETLKAVRNMGIPVYMGQRAENIEGADLIVYTAAIMSDNPELIAAKASGVKTVERCELLGLVTSWYNKAVCVSGTHGKTTTSSMLTHMYLAQNIDLSTVIGGKLKAIGGSGRAGSSDVMVCEACEFSNTFLHLFPNISIILNIDADHLDFFKTMDNLRASFTKFCDNTTDILVVNGDDENTMRAVKASGFDKQIITFGKTDKNRYYPENIKRISDFQTDFDLMENGNKIERISIHAPGSTFVAGKRPWEVKADIELPCATQNELNGEDAQHLIDNKVTCVGEISNMGCTPEAIDLFIDNKIMYAPGKAVNAGGVATSGLEMSQNAMHLSWSAAEVDEKLHAIMHGIHAQCVKYGTEPDGYINYVKGANIAGFMKVAHAMMGQGII